MSNPQVPIEPKPIPPEIDRWNWGAFLLNWIWGVGNNTFIALLDPHSDLRSARDAFRARRQRQPLGLAQRPLGQRRAFQARAALVGHMGSHHLVGFYNALRRRHWAPVFTSSNIPRLTNSACPQCGPIP